MEEKLNRSAFRVYDWDDKYAEIHNFNNDLRIELCDSDFTFTSWQQAEIFHKMLGEYVAEYKEMEINKTIET